MAEKEEGTSPIIGVFYLGLALAIDWFLGIVDTILDFLTLILPDFLY